MTTKIEQAAAFFNAGDLLKATRLCEEILAANRFDADALHQLGLIEARHGRFPEALAHLNRAATANPALAAVQVNRGNVLRALGRIEEALAAFDAAIRLDPSLLGAHNNRGNALWQLGRDEEAIAAYRHVLRLDPYNVDALLNCGRSLAELKRYDEAYVCYDRLLARQPDHYACLYNYGIALDQQGRLEESLARYRKAQAHRPDDIAAANAAFGIETRLADWRDWEMQASRLFEAVRAGKPGVAPMHYVQFSDDPAGQLACGRLWTASKYPKAAQSLWNGERYGHERIRITYLSADLREHAVSYLTASLFERHDRARFEVIAVSSAEPVESAMRTRLLKAFDRFIDVSDRNDFEVATLVRELEIDIVVDLNGHSAGTRMGALAFRPAPVTVSHLGFPATSGADYIDYIVADPYVIPPGAERFYSEAVVRMPDTFQVNDDARKASARQPTRAELGLPERGFVFCSFNRSNKITPPFFDLWMSLLTEVPGSVLWLVGGNDAVERNLRAEANRRGIASDRLVFAANAPYADHLARHSCADLFLDLLPFNAGTTASDALWMGLPVVAISGAAYPARMAGSLLHAVGLADLIAPTLDDYRALALKLATDPSALAAVKARLDANRKTSALFDTDRFRRHIEQAYVTMRQRAEQGLPPKSFSIGESAP